jgi:hypothetical protein
MLKEKFIQEMKDLLYNDMYNYEDARLLIDDLYVSANQAPPKMIIHVQSPQSLDYSFYFVKQFLQEINNPAWKNFNDKVWIATKERIKKQPLIRIGNQKLWNYICDETWKQIKLQLTDDLLQEFGYEVNGVIYRQLKQTASHQNEPNRYNLVPPYFHNIENELISNKYTKLNMMATMINCFNSVYLRQAGIFSISCYENICFVTMPPSFIRLNDREQLDSKTDYAMYWNDGYGKYYVSGIRLEDDLFRRAFILKNIKPEEIMATENLEIKSVLIKEYGYDYIKSTLKHFKMLDTYETVSKITGKKTTYELFEYDLEPRVPMRIVKVECHTTHQVTFIGVPRVKDTENCIDAIGWTFGFGPGEYNPVKES